MAKAFRLTPPRIPESALHQQIAKALSLEISTPGRVSKDGVVWWSVDMASYQGTTPGLRTARGCIAGIPDMLVVYEGLGHFIEIKAKDGIVSPAQQKLGVAILMAGARWGVATNVEEALGLLDCWEIPRSRRLRIAGKRA